MNSMIWRIKLYFFDKINATYNKEKVKRKDIDKLKKSNETKIKLMNYLVPFVIELLAIILIFVCFTISLLISVGILLLIAMIFSLETSKASLFISLIVGVFGALVTIKANNRKNEQNEQDYMLVATLLMDYMVELVRGNTNYKLCKNDLSKILLICPNEIIRIIRDLQINIKNQDDFAKQQICFLINFSRSFLNINYDYSDVLDLSIIDEVVDNSSTIENESNNRKKTNKAKKNNRKVKNRA